MRRVSSLIMVVFTLIFVSLGGCVTRHAPGNSAAANPDAALAAGKGVSHWNDKDALVVPFEYNRAEETAPAVWLNINGKPRRFIVDTGSDGPLTLWNDTAKKLKIKPQNKWTTRSGSSGADFQVQNVSLSCFSAQKNKKILVPLPKVSGDILDAHGFLWGGFLNHPVGLIGNRLLRRLGRAVRFDFVSRKMTIYRRVNAPLRISGAATVPLHRSDGVYAVNVPLPDGGVQEMLVDTGCEGHVYIPQRLARRFHTAERAADGGTFKDATGEHGAIESVMPSLTVGNFTEKNVLTTQGQAGDDFALLSMNYLSRFRVTLDYAHSELTLERASDYTRHLYKP